MPEPGRGCTAVPTAHSCPVPPAGMCRAELVPSCEAEADSDTAINVQSLAFITHTGLQSSPEPTPRTASWAWGPKSHLLTFLHCCHNPLEPQAPEQLSLAGHFFTQGKFGGFFVGFFVCLIFRKVRALKGIDNFLAKNHCNSSQNTLTEKKKKDINIPVFFFSKVKSPRYCQKWICSQAL